MQSASAYEQPKECARCKGAGWITEWVKGPEWVYGANNGMKVEVATRCPSCNGVSRKQEESARERANIPRAFYSATMIHFRSDVYEDAKGQKVDGSAIKETLQNYVDHFAKWKEQGYGLYIHSRTKGSGKTFAASCVANSLIAGRHITVRFVPCSQLLNLAEDRRASLKQGTPEMPEYDIAKMCDLLVLDDIGVKNTGSDWMNDVLFDIIDYRMNKKLPTLYTSNIAMDKLNFDPRIMDRIAKTTYQVSMPECAVRSRQAAADKADFLKQIGLRGD